MLEPAKIQLGIFILWAIACPAQAQDLIPEPVPDVISERIPELIQSTEQSQPDWYQVEVIIFANKTPPTTDEAWPEATLQYPARMISVAPGARPFSLQQLQDTQAYLALFGESQVGGPDNQRDIARDDQSTNQAMNGSSEEFLFESRNQFKMPTPEMTNELSNGIDSGLEGVEIDYDDLFQASGPRAFEPLANEYRVLNDLARSIRRSSLYQPLYHNAWRQPVESEADALPILIQAGEHFDDSFQLDGTITVSRSRFLHIDTDLWFTEFASLYNGGPQSAVALTGISKEQYPDVVNWESSRGQNLKTRSHQLRQSRRMRSSTLHFIDHPQFGVLIRIDRFDEQENS